MTAERPINPWLIAVSVMFATFMEVLDTTVVNVSLPHIAGNLSATIDESTWVLTSYLVANAIVLPLTGWLASYFGRKRLLMTSVAGFTLSSLLCGLAWNIESMLVFRAIQGFLGGGMIPTTMAALLNRPAFGPYLQVLGANRAYEPAALAVISFAITWICMGFIQLITRFSKHTKAQR